MSNLNQMVKLDDNMLAQMSRNNPIVGEVLILRESGLFPDTEDLAVALTKAMAGRELGVGPLASQSAFYLMPVKDAQGKYSKKKLEVWTNYLKALAKKRGYYWHVISWTRQECEILFWHKTLGKLGPCKLTWQDCTDAGLTNGPNSHTWNKFPKHMLMKSCIRLAIMTYAPEVLVGGVDEARLLDEPLEQSEVDISSEPEILIADDVLDAEERGQDAAEELSGPSLAKEDETRLINQSERSSLFGKASEVGLSKEGFRQLLIDLYKDESTSKLTIKQYHYLMDEKFPALDQSIEPQEGSKKHKVLLGA